MVFSVSGEEVESVAVQVVNVYGHCSPVGEADNEPFLKELVRDKLYSLIIYTTSTSSHRTPMHLFH